MRYNYWQLGLAVVVICIIGSAETYSQLIPPCYKIQGKWHTNIITFRIDTGPNGIPSSWQSAILAAADQWNRAAIDHGVNIRLVVDPSSENIITAAEPYELTNPNAVAVAVRWFKDRRGNLSQTDPAFWDPKLGVPLVFKLGMYFNRELIRTGNFSSSASINGKRALIDREPIDREPRIEKKIKYDVWSVALHEFGHWFGLGDIEFRRFDCLTVMRYSAKMALGGKIRQPEKDDIIGIKTIYYTTFALPARVLFVYNNGIYSMNLDGTDVVRLSGPNDYDLDPWGSPDGTKILFSSMTRGCPFSYASGIFVMNRDGTNPIQLTGHNCDTNDRFPRFSPDGTKIVFSRFVDGGWRVFIMNSDGTNIRQLTTSTVLGDFFATFTPDGKAIIYCSYTNNGIFIMNLDGSNARLIKDQTIGCEDGLDVSIQGRIVFTKIDFSIPGNPPSCGLELYSMNLDGSDLKRLTNNTVCDALPVFSDDGQKIFFFSNGDIYVMNLDGSNQQRLTFTGDSTLTGFLRAVPSTTNHSNSLNTLSMTHKKTVRVPYLHYTQGKWLIESVNNVHILELEVFNLSGRAVFNTKPILNTFVWNGIDNEGKSLANGVYLYVITYHNDGETIIKKEVKKIVVLR